MPGITSQRRVNKFIMTIAQRTHKKNILLIIFIIIATMVMFILLYKKDIPQKKIIATAATTTASELISYIKPTDPVTITQSSQTSKTLEDDLHIALTSDNIIWYTNYYRNQYGIAPLTLSSQLRNSAYYKSVDMFNYNYFNHYRPTNQLGFDNFIDNQNYRFIKIGENLAQGNFTTSKAVVDAWMRSPEHRRNILDTTYTEIGVSVDLGTLNGEEVFLITQHFGKPLTTCPYVDQGLNVTIKNITKQLIQMKKDIESSEEDSFDMITTYNTLIQERAVLVIKYNKQVDAFDTCLSRG